MKPMSKSIFRLGLLLVSFSGFCQQQSADSTAVPVNADRYGIRVGLDLHRIAKSFYADDFRGFEAVADYRLTKRLYAAAEAGNEKTTIDDEQLNFTTSGTYIKVGVDYNLHNNWEGLENMIYLGVRYGISSFSQNLNSYEIYDNSGYFDRVTVYPDSEFNGLAAQWIELVAGLKAEIFKNVFLGFSFRLNNLTSNKKPENFDNLYIPGFNRTYEGNVGVGLNYTVSYFIPLYKKTAKAVEVKK